MVAVRLDHDQVGIYLVRVAKLKCSAKFWEVVCVPDAGIVVPLLTVAGFVVVAILLTWLRLIDSIYWFAMVVLFR